MSRFDVVVVGAGPAGLSAARVLAGFGFATIVLERQSSVAENVRTSGATALETVTRLGTPTSLYHLVERIRISSSNSAATLPAGQALCVLDVRGFYRWLAGAAQDQGAVIATGTTARAPTLERGRVTGCVVTDDEGSDRSIEARVVIDAGGYRAQMSKDANLHPGFTRFGVGAEYELQAPSADQRELVIIVGDRYAPAGYGWCFPWGGDRVRLGVGIHHADVRADPKAHLAVLYDAADELQLGTSGALITEHHFGLIPAEGLASRFAGDGIVAVGDAAGQATLVAGEGIRISLLAGELAGRTVAKALTAGRTDHEALVPYERRFRSEFGRQLRVGQRLNARLAASDDEDWERRIRLLQSMPPALVVDLLQSRIRLRRVVGWAVRKPGAFAEAARLLRAVGVAR